MKLSSLNGAAGVLTLKKHQERFRTVKLKK
jgi:hypothetical protein